MSNSDQGSMQLLLGSLSTISDDVLGVVLLFCNIKDIVVTLPQVNQRLYQVSTSDTVWDFLYQNPNEGATP